MAIRSAPMIPISNANRRWWILAALGGTLSMVVIDETVIGVALPTMRHDLGMGLVASHWVVNAYLLVFTCFAATVGKLEDLFVVPLFLWGCSMPFLYVLTRHALMEAAPAESKGQAGGVQLTFQFLGGTLGTAVCGSLVAMTGGFQLAILFPPILGAIFLVVAWRTMLRS